MPRVWLITGTSRGLGRALAEAVLADGDHLVATARDPAQLGADAVAGASAAAEALAASDARWRELSESIAFDATP
ncbi:hypothetical protein [Micromonospora cabrerizensis]|uniref:hypothetical protein n=1 Tax=Micromonospora cabrerizensis TaxID=2911213 RepID=UPI003556128D